MNCIGLRRRRRSRRRGISYGIGKKLKEKGEKMKREKLLENYVYSYELVCL